MMPRLSFLLIGLTILACGSGIAAASAATPHVKEIRFGVYQSKTRIVIDIEGRVSPMVFVRSNPHRLVVRLPEVTWSPRLRKGMKAGLVSGTDVRRFRPGVSQIEFRTRIPVRVRKQFTLEPRKTASGTHRVVVDIVSAVPKTQRGDRSASASRSRSSGKRPTPPEQRQPRLRPEKQLVMLDPGHGGIDPGATSRSGLREKDLVLEFAKELRRALVRTGRYRVRMTREGDRFVSLRKRVKMALDADSDLFISIHADAYPDSSFGGFSVYTRDKKASDKRAALLAARENNWAGARRNEQGTPRLAANEDVFDKFERSELGENDPETADILGDLGYNGARNSSVEFADLLVSEMEKVRSGIPKTRRSAGFAVLRTVLTHPYVPSVLLELGYLTNKEDERLLRRPAKRARLVAAIVRAVDRFFSTRSAALRP